MLLEAALRLAKSKAGILARMTGKSETEIKQAIEQGSKILPEILKSKDGGVDAFRKMGIPRSFMDEMYTKYGRFADKIPGLSRSNVEGAYRSLYGAIGEAPTGKRAGKPKGFDGTKYPRV